MNERKFAKSRVSQRRKSKAFIKWSTARSFISTESEHDHLCQMEVSRRRRRKRKRRFPSWELELGERDNEISE